MTYKEWHARGLALFGPDPLPWRFVCPVCQHVAAVAAWKAAGAPEGAVGFSCVGRWSGGTGTMNQAIPDRPCNDAGGDLFPLNPVEVTREDGTTIRMFAFAGPDVAPPPPLTTESASA